MSIAAVLLSGGQGTRFGSVVPKQYILLQQKAIALYSFERLFLNHRIQEIIIVCDPLYENLFIESNTAKKHLVFARPGKQRQDSLYNGAEKISKNMTHALIHDAARPFISNSMIERVIEEGVREGAATLAMPVKSTIKEADARFYVTKTPDRNTLYEIQTPQILRLDLMHKGFQKAQERGINATDDVFFAEILGHPVKLVEGSYSNVKITTPEDLEYANSIWYRFSSTES